MSQQSAAGTANVSSSPAAAGDDGSKSLKKTVSSSRTEPSMGPRKTGCWVQPSAPAIGQQQRKEPIINGGRKSSFKITSVRDIDECDCDEDSNDGPMRCMNNERQNVKDTKCRFNAVQPAEQQRTTTTTKSTSAADNGGANKKTTTTDGTAVPAAANNIRRAHIDYVSQLSAGVEEAKVTEIGGKIDKAMDLVKVHLLYTVRMEMKHLKEQIHDLDRELNRLKMENQFLRKHVSVLVLAQLERANAMAQSGSAP